MIDEPIMMSLLAKSPLGKYWAAIKASPTGLYGWRVLLTVAMYALAGMPRGNDTLRFENASVC